MYKQILVPVDGSSTSDLALQEAVKLAKDQQARLRIIHVVDTLTLTLGLMYADINDIQRILRDAGQDLLNKAEASAREAGIEVEAKLIETETVGQRTSGVIVEEAKIWPADLIVIGTHGRRGLDHMLMGSVAEGVVRISPKPVLLIRG